MTKPFISIDQQKNLTKEMEIGSLMVHNEPPAMVVLVTALEGEQAGDFTGAVLDTGVHLNSFIGSEFTLFEGSITLTQ
jgi:hypothetical protein